VIEPPCVRDVGRELEDAIVVEFAKHDS
jgi:hypothetical protein